MITDIIGEFEIKGYKISNIQLLKNIVFCFT